MKQLIFHEFKKVFKNKLFIIIMIALIGWTGLEAYRSYYPDVHRVYGAGNWQYEDNNLVYQDENGNDLDGLEYLKFADSLLHSYAGKANQKLWDVYYQDYLDKVHELEVDEERTTAYFGNEGWKELYKAGLTGEVTQSEIAEYCNEVDGKCYDEDYLAPIIYEKMEYADAMTRIYLNQMFDGDIHVTPAVSYIYALVNKKEFVNDSWFDYKIIQDKTEYTKYLQDRFIETDTEFDSVIPNNLLINNMSLINFFTLLVIAMVCANIFSIEAQYKTNQILIPTKLGSMKLAIAKLITGISISFIVVFAQIVVIFALSYILLPVHQMDLFVYEQAGTYGGFLGYMYNEVVAGYLLTTITASLVIGMITMFTSYVFQNRFVSVITSFLIVMIPFFILQGKTGIFAIVERFMPALLMDYGNLIRIGESPVIMMNNSFVEWQYVVIVIWMTIMIGMVAYIVFDSKRHLLKSR